MDGLGQVELDAIEPNNLRTMCGDALNNIFYQDRETEMREQETKEIEQFRSALRKYVSTL